LKENLYFSTTANGLVIITKIDKECGVRTWWF